MRPSTMLGRPALGSTLIGSGRVLAEVAQVLLHLGRAGGAVDAEHVGAHRGERRRAAAPISLPTSIRPVVSIVTWTCSGTLRPAAGIARRQPIIAALTCSRSMHVSMRNRSTPPSSRPARLLLVGVAQLGEADVAEARQLRAGTDRAGDVAGPAVGGVVVGDLAGDAGRGDVELVGLVGDVVLGEHGREAAEARRLDGVDADVEERRVHAGDDVGPGEAQHLVAALERGAAEVVGGEVEALHVRAERAVEDDDALVHRVEVGLRAMDARGYAPGAAGPAARHPAVGCPRHVAIVTRSRASSRAVDVGPERPAWRHRPRTVRA